MSDAARMANMEARLQQLERIVRPRVGALPQQPEVGEVTDLTPDLVVTLSESTPVTPATVFGAPEVGDAGMIVWPYDAAPVGFFPQRLSGLADVTLTAPAAGEVLAYDGTSWVNGIGGNFGAHHVDVATYTSSFNVNGSSVNVAVGQSIASLIVCELRNVGGTTATGNVDGDPGGGTATFTGSFDTRCEFSLAVGERRTMVVTYGRTGCTVAGTQAPQADVSLTGSTVEATVTFFWMVY